MWGSAGCPGGRMCVSGTDGQTDRHTDTARPDVSASGRPDVTQELPAWGQGRAQEVVPTCSGHT